MYRSLTRGEFSPEITPTPSYYSGVQPLQNISEEEQLVAGNRQTFEMDDMVARKPLPSYLKSSSQYEHVNPIPEPLQEFSEAREDKGFQWRPGVWTHIPVPGILAVVGALICIAGTVAVLVRSDGMLVTHWTLSPTVYIALMTTGTNMLLRFAFHEGNKIAWWYKAIQGGTLRDLHSRWESGDGFWGALGSGRRFNLVSLASLAATLIVIDQPLIQRASTIVSADFTKPSNITAFIAPEIPYGYTGAQYGRGSSQQVMTQPMIAAFNDYNSQAPITPGFTGCTDTCTGFVDAGGLAAECTTVTGPIAYLQSPRVNASNGILDSAFLAQSPFSVNFTLRPQQSMNASYIQMDVAYTTNAHTGNCGGTLVYRSCKLRSATLSYPITLHNLTLELGNITQDARIKAFQPAGNSSGSIDGGGDYGRWTLGGLYLAATSLFQANATYQFIGALGTLLTLPDTLSNQFLETPVGNDTLYGLGIPQVCFSNWTDPTSHILSALNQIAFRVSINGASFPYRNTTAPIPPRFITMQEVRTVNVFKSVYKYLAASTALTIVCVVLVLPTFIGWWELGRSVSLNPLELAKAFDAPLMNGPGSNAPLHELVNTMGMRTVRYGEIDGYGSGQVSRRELKLADPRGLVRPSAGMVYE